LFVTQVKVANLQRRKASELAVITMEESVEELRNIERKSNGESWCLNE
jgi:hypothetical protein